MICYDGNVDEKEIVQKNIMRKRGLKGNWIDE